MSALTVSFSLVLCLFPIKPFCFHKMALETGDQISEVDPLEQLGGQRLLELVGLQLR